MSRPWATPNSYIGTPASDDLPIAGNTKYGRANTLFVAGTGITPVVPHTHPSDSWERTFLADADGHIGAGDLLAGEILR